MRRVAQLEEEDDEGDDSDDDGDDDDDEHRENMRRVDQLREGVPSSVAWTLMGCATDVRNKVNSRHLWHTHPA